MKEVVRASTIHESYMYRFQITPLFLNLVPKAKTTTVTPSFYCSFLNVLVPSLKKIWMVHQFQVNYLKLTQSYPEF